ncbi:hypothetical protein Lsai_0449 [Legionella sainthelensi]|uniref:DUF1189 domain-containing protein n=1 Tax=Legionella sainthelensi TaxID=28087 RepID=A0A0W0YSE6_9GAMM|nr:DUF1189 family protein [Legionella sainthelensi]KTD59805.1 hypothetical protein Lsai_0449 [Legionella sainthelensi]VEH31413.1 Protein of uncharacterised function (DUF1189) [Legionella sainthelensi]
MSKEKNKLKSIDTPNYRYWSALYMSLYSRLLYVDVGKRWKGLGFLYLLLAIALFSIPFVIRMDLSFNNSFNEQLIKPLEEIPIFYIQEGNVVFDKPMPYLVKNDKGQVNIIIDTTGQVNDFSKYPSLAILVNKNKISLKIPNLQLFNMPQAQFSSGPPMVQEFSKEDNAVFDGKMIAKEKTITNMKYFAQVLMYPMIVAVLFSMFITFFLVFGFLGQVFSSVFFSFSITFKQSCRLLIVAATPMLIALILLLTSNYIFPGSGFILLFLLIGYFSYALFALRAESKKVVRT